MNRHRSPSGLLEPSTVEYVAQATEIITCHNPGAQEV